MYANPPEDEFQGTISAFRKRNKISSVLVYVLNKMRIRHFHVVVVQKRQRNVQKKNDARANFLLFCSLNIFFDVASLAEKSFNLACVLVRRLVK